jgi:hypothetical protein
MSFQSALAARLRPLKEHTSGLRTMSKGTGIRLPRVLLRGWLHPSLAPQEVVVPPTSITAA